MGAFGSILEHVGSIWELFGSFTEPFGGISHITVWGISHIASRVRLGLLDILHVLLDLQYQLQISMEISIEAIFSISSTPRLDN